MTQDENGQETVPDENANNEGEDNSQIGEDQNLGVIEEGQSNVTPQAPTNDPLQLIENLQVDPTVKKVLKAGFLRQADYTQKTQALSEDRKLVDEYKELKPYFDKVLSDPTLYEQVFGQKPADPNAPTYPEDPVEYANWVKNETIRTIQQEFDINQAEQVDPRLNADQDFAYSIAGIVAQDKEFLAGKKSATDATREAVTRFDTFLRRQKEIWRKELDTKLSQKRMIVPNTNSAISAGGGKVPSTMQEAAKMAEEQIQS